MMVYTEVPQSWSTASSSKSISCVTSIPNIYAHDVYLKTLFDYFLDRSLFSPVHLITETKDVRP